jgi:succinoglycan biosynthesis transport protein ExoP
MPTLPPKREESPPASAGEPALDFRKYLSLLWTYKWVIAGSTVLVGAAVIVWTLRQPRVYQASCTIEYDPNQLTPLGEEVEDVSNPLGSFWMSREFFMTQNRIITSRAVAERVVEREQLHHDAEFLGVPESQREGWEGVSVTDAAGVLQGRLSVQPVEDTRLVSIRVVGLNPRRAAEIANAVADEYIEKTIEDRSGSTHSAQRWLGERLDTLRTDLEESELALHRFKEQHNVLSVSMEDRQNLVASEIQHMNEALTQARTARIERMARVERIRAAAEGDTPEESAAAFGENETISALREQLRAKIAEREGLVRRYGPEHQRMQQLDSEIANGRRQLREEIAGVLRAAEADVREIRHIEGGLTAALEESHRQGFELNLREIEYGRLNRNRENNSKLYDIVLERSTETGLTGVWQSTYARMLDRALPPTSPISPNLTTNSAGGIGVGLAIGLALAFLLSRLDRRLKSVSDVESAGMTILGILPKIEEGFEAQPYPSKKPVRRRAAQKPSGVSRDTFVHTHPMSAAAECCRTIRTNLTFMSADEPIRTLVVTSASPREGKTTVTTNIAISVAQSGKRVLLIDTDLRRPRIHRAFNVSGARGVTSVIVGDEKLESVVAQTDVPNLDVLPCGPIPPNPSELLHSQRFREMVEEALRRYDRVIFDSPPLVAVTDAAVLAPQLDAVLVVVQAHKTTREALGSALRQLRDVGANIVGGIFNGVDPRKNGYSAGDYYYYYRREGYYYADENRPSDEHAPPPA